MRDLSFLLHLMEYTVQLASCIRVSQPPRSAHRWSSNPSKNAIHSSRYHDCCRSARLLHLLLLILGRLCAPQSYTMRKISTSFPSCTMLTSVSVASGLVYQTQASTAPTLPYSNGHLSPTSRIPTVNTVVTPDSESDLSEPIDLSNVPTPLVNGGTRHQDEQSREELSASESSPQEDALGSDDPDYNLDTPPTYNARSAGDARSSSQDSPRQRKRKSSVNHDDYMLNDPELYGLRRSVGSRKAGASIMLTSCLKGRPRPTHQIVRYFLFRTTLLLADTLVQIDDDSGDEDSGSDIQSGPPRKRRKPTASRLGMSSNII